jgi:foldase protein PrsA
VSKTIRSIAALGAVFFVSVGLAACGGIPGDAVVQVNGHPITKDTFNHWMVVAASASTASTSAKPAKPVIPEPPEYKACITHLQTIEPTPAKGQKKKTPAELKTTCEQQYKALQQQVLGFLISYDWLEGAAIELSVNPSDKSVVKKFNELKKQEFPTEAKFNEFLASTGYTVSDLLLRVKQNLLQTKVQEKVTKDAKKVSEAEVTKYYEQHKSSYGQPEKRDLRIILTKTEANASKAKSEIQGGQSFASVAKSKSIDTTTKNNGGELAGVVKGEEEKALSEAVFAAKTGVLSGPVKTPFGYYIFEVKAIHAPTQKKLSEVKSTVKQQLVSQGQQGALTKFIKEFQKKWKGRTECRSEYVVQDCKQYKAPKTTATPAAPTPTPTTSSSASGSTTTATTGSATTTTK